MEGSRLVVVGLVVRFPRPRWWKSESFLRFLFPFSSIPKSQKGHAFLIHTLSPPRERKREGCGVEQLRTARKGGSKEIINTETGKAKGFPFFCIFLLSVSFLIFKLSESMGGGDKIGVSKLLKKNLQFSFPNKKDWETKFLANENRCPLIFTPND